jgi:hypothetical protein
MDKDKVLERIINPLFKHTIIKLPQKVGKPKESTIPYLIMKEITFIILSGLMKLLILENNLLLFRRAEQKKLQDS